MGGDADEGFAFDGFDQVVKGTQSQRILGGYDVGVAGDHHHRTGHASRADIFEDIHTGLVVEDDVDKKEVELGAVDGIHGSVEAVRGCNLMTFLAEKGPEGEPYAFLIINNQDSVTHALPQSVSFSAVINMRQKCKYLFGKV